MSTAYDVRYPGRHGPGEPTARGRRTGRSATIRSVTDSVEDYARREPLKFAAWVFGIGFILGWKMKPW